MVLTLIDVEIVSNIRLFSADSVAQTVLKTELSLSAPLASSEARWLSRARGRILVAVLARSSDASFSSRVPHPTLA